jgi:hypothetical protein
MAIVAAKNYWTSTAKIAASHGPLCGSRSLLLTCSHAGLPL